MSFHIGQQVICVDDQFSSDPYWRSTVRAFPKLKTIYTIREIIEGYGRQQGLIGFCLHEIVSPPALFIAKDGWPLLEPAFNSKNFRPIRSTNIEIFKKLLVPKDRELVS